MSDYVYYRGSSSYLDTVNNCLSEATRGISNIGNSLTDLTSNLQEINSGIQDGINTYIAGTNANLNMQAQTQDAIYSGIYATQAMGANIQSGIQTGIYAIQNMSTGISNTIRESTMLLFTQNEMLKKNFTQGFYQVNNTLNSGFGMVGNKLDFIAERLCIQSEQLDKLLFNQANPSLMASRESQKRAINCCKIQNFEKAVFNCKTAVENNNIDYESWYLLGYVYLFGAGEIDNVIDIDKAIEALTEANNTSWFNPDCPDELKSEICYYLGYAKLIKSNDLMDVFEEALSKTNNLVETMDNFNHHKLQDKNNIINSEQEKNNNNDIKLRKLSKLKSFNHKRPNKFQLKTYKNK